jgi:type 1 glutamine amidotransferase
MKSSIMKNTTLLIKCLLTLAVFCLGIASARAATPKKLLVVSVTKGFRHSSIPTAEKVLAQLGEQSGAFTVDYARVEPSDPEFKGADGKPDKAKVDAAIQKVLADKMSPASLKNYDGVIFANTTGDLPLPDKQAFIDWIKSGKAFVGMHSASDTFHGFPAYIEMLGGEFQIHHAQVRVDCQNHDPKHPATRDLGAAFTVFDEIYLQKNFHRDQVHVLLALDAHPNEKTPGFYPIAWCKDFGNGRVFYTALGHREDMWDADTPEKFKRENSKEIAAAYQKHILGGILWALGLEKGDGKPQSK